MATETGGALRIVLGDQLSRDVAALRDLDPAHDTVLMMEVADEATYVPHHPKKIAFILSAMRHFAEALRGEGIRVDYVRLDDPDNTGSFTGEVVRAAARNDVSRLVVTEPGEWRVLQAMRDWGEETGRDLDIREDDRFLCSHAEFAAWAKDRKALRMEHFYRLMRRSTGYLMEGDTPVAGQWNFDQENRKRLPDDLSVPSRTVFPPDEITRGVIDLVADRFPHHFGDLEPFGFAVTRADALIALDAFVVDCLPRFGDYQDAMARQEPFLFHAVLSPYINAGLLDPREVCDAAVAAYEHGAAPINAVEGFVRQIIGWREYVRGIYWLKMPGYAKTNALGAHRSLPDFYWTGDTDMACMAAAIADTRRNAYAHHIQRLMVTGNFALLAAVSPEQIEAWYLAVYADAYEWVELPNTHGMAIFADGGLLASKPYAASGAYINRMSDYCRGCRYDVKSRHGETACPFNYLYWNFVATHQDTLRSNRRMVMVYRSLDRMDSQVVMQMQADADAFLTRIASANNWQRSYIVAANSLKSNN